MSETRYCSNCRAVLPPRATACPSCGVFAGDVFDGRKPRPPRRGPSGLLFFLLVSAILGGAAWWFYQEQARQAAARVAPPPPLPSVRVVTDRPGGARRATGAIISEAEAIRVLRRHLVATLKISNDCLGVMSALPRDGAYILTAVNGCDHTRLGRWRVDGKTSAITRVK